MVMVRVGVAAMQRKLVRPPMQLILKGLREFASFQIIEMDEKVMSLPVQDWPLVDCLLALCSDTFPLERVISYAQLRKPFVVNDLHLLSVIRDRWSTLELLRQCGVPTPAACIVNRNMGHTVLQADDYLYVYSSQQQLMSSLQKPFVEKPLNADDHNVYIYYAGGGVRRLFRKVKDKSSTFIPHVSQVRTAGNYIYEKFYSPERCADIKVYAVGDYYYAEARKAPHVDGIVERDSHGFERRIRVKLTDQEIRICEQVSAAFRQFVNGFDLLRVPGKGTFVIDVNGWSFVKRSSEEYTPICVAKLIDLIMCNVSYRILGLAARPPLLPPQVDEQTHPVRNMQQHHR